MESFTHEFIKGESAFTVLLLHGTGGDEHDMLPLGTAIAPHANLLSPRGKVEERGMLRFFERTPEGGFVEESVLNAANGLAAFVEECAERYSFDAKKVVALGYSNGANTAAAILLERPTLLRGAALLHAKIPLKGRKANLKRIPIFLSAGKLDGMIPFSETEKLERLLKEGGANITTHWNPGGHEITHDEVRAAKAWFAEEFGND